MGELEKNINGGISAIRIDNIDKINDTEIRNKLKTLMRPLVNDEQLLDILTTEPNQQKLKFRLEHNVYLLNDMGEKMYTLTSIGKKTTREVIDDVNSNFKIDMDFEEMYDKADKFGRELGYSTNSESKGKLSKIEIRIIFRKGK